MKIEHLLEDRNTKYLYRGVPKSPRVSNMPEELTLDIKSQDRRPRDTSTFVHRMINALCVEKFGVPVRNLAFFYLEYGPASNYGQVYYTQPTQDMTFYYADGIKDFTQHYDSDKFLFLNGWSFANKVISTKAFGTLDHLDTDTQRSMFEMMNTDSIRLSDDINTVDDIEKSFRELGEEFYNRFQRRGYDVTRETVISMVVEALHDYFRRFYEYVDKIEVTKNINSVPDDVEVMVDVASGKITLEKFQKPAYSDD